MEVRSNSSDAHERLFAVLGEHGGDDVHDDGQFCLVRSCYIDKDVSSVQSDFAVVGIDDRRHG